MAVSTKGVPFEGPGVVGAAGPGADAVPLTWMAEIPAAYCVSDG